jgi:hypothetical protein
VVESNSAWGRLCFSYKMLSAQNPERTECSQQRMLMGHDAYNNNKTIAAAAAASAALVSAEEKVTSNVKSLTSVQQSTCVGQNCVLLLGFPGPDANSLTARALLTSCTWLSMARRSAACNQHALLRSRTCFFAAALITYPYLARCEPRLRSLPTYDSN